MPGRSVPVARVDGGGLFLHLGDGAYDLDVALCVHQQRAEGRVPRRPGLLRDFDGPPEIVFMALVRFLNLLLFQKPPFRVQHYGIRLRAQLLFPGIGLRQRPVQPLQHAVDAGIGALHLLRGLLYPVQHHPVHKKPSKK